MVMVRTNLTLPAELLEQIDGSPARAAAARTSRPSSRSRSAGTSSARSSRRRSGHDRQARLDEPGRGARVRQGAASELGPTRMRYVLDTTLLIDVANGVPAARSRRSRRCSTSRTICTHATSSRPRPCLRGRMNNETRSRACSNVLEYVSTHPGCRASRGGHAPPTRPDEPPDARRRAHRRGRLVHGGDRHHPQPGRLHRPGDPRPDLLTDPASPATPTESRLKGS